MCLLKWRWLRLLLREGLREPRPGCPSTIGIRKSFNKLVNTMKFRYVVIAVLAAIYCIACEKEVTVNSNLQKGLTIQATTHTSTESATRTSFDGSKTQWITDDEITVMVGESGSSAFSGYTFTCQDGQTGTFVNGTIGRVSESEYDFYAVYPSSAVNCTDLSANITIGAAMQTQEGSSPNHIAQLDPLTGYVLNSHLNSVSIPMKHNAAVMAVKVVNGLAESVFAKSLKVVADNEIALCGTYDIDIASGELSNATDTNNEVVVNVANATAIPQDGFVVYAAIAPCALPENATLTFVITDSNNTEYEFTKGFKDGFDIVAGDLLSTSFDLASAKAITYNPDFTTVPDGFPTTATTQSEAIYYSFNGKSIGFYNAAGYKYDKDNKLIRFESVGKTDAASAKIYIPQMAGYKLASLNISNDIVSQNAHQFSLYNNDGMVLMTGSGSSAESKYIVSTNEVELKSASVVTYIRVFAYSSTRVYKCKGLLLRYVKTE